MPDETTEESSSRLSVMPSSTRTTQSNFDVRSAAPAYSDISWHGATHQERMDEIERMHSRIDYISSHERGHAAFHEMATLRAYVAQLETQLYGRNDESPPEY